MWYAFAITSEFDLLKQVAHLQCLNGKWRASGLLKASPATPPPPPPLRLSIDTDTWQNIQAVMDDSTLFCRYSPMTSVWDLKINGRCSDGAMNMTTIWFDAYYLCAAECGCWTAEGMLPLLSSKGTVRSTISPRYHAPLYLGEYTSDQWCLWINTLLDQWATMCGKCILTYVCGFRACMIMACVWL